MDQLPEGRRDILIVDDSDADVALFQRILTSKNPNAVVHSAASGEEVQNYMRRRKGGPDMPSIDLVIIDLNIPKEGGLAILEDLKSDENLRRIPVIVMTGSSSRRDVERAYELGANSYLVKPGAFEEFAKVVGFIDSYWLRGVSNLPSHELAPATREPRS